MLPPSSISEKHKGLRLATAMLLGATIMFLNSCEKQPVQQTQTVTLVQAEQSQALSDQLGKLSTIVTAFDIAPAPQVERRLGKLQHRDTLIDALGRMGADSLDAHGAVQAASEFIDMRRLRPGQTFAAFFDLETPAPTASDNPGSDFQRLSGISFNPDPTRHVLVNRTVNGDWVSRELKAKALPGHERVGGTITSSIYELALRQGAADQQVVDFASIFAYDVDFQREIYPNDFFEIVYEAAFDERGDKIQGGEVLYARLDGSRVQREFYRFTTEDDGVTDYYDANGEAARKFLMKTPINGARLSSHFGRRIHPVLGYTKMHKGTDFAAPSGTPIYAAGHGVVERASRWGGYGNYIRIRHANGYKTAYAHLKGYARGIRAGKRVRQGDVIGYVGSTGRSTGPHLHYEVLVNGKHVNAMSLDLPTGRKLEGEMLEQFNAEKARIDALRDAHALPPVEHASAAQPKEPA